MPMKLQARRKKLENRQKYAEEEKVTNVANKFPLKTPKINSFKTIIDVNVVTKEVIKKNNFFTSTKPEIDIKISEMDIDIISENKAIDESKTFFKEDETPQKFEDEKDSCVVNNPPEPVYITEDDL
mmetsp:Transcript_6232/g.6986  ORF Transcript_6232/g.6986 Transcript_6232/m.6986 type:complete len:126 (+) Transcript_6232:157-534(+)